MVLVTVHEAKTHLSKLIKMAENGEEIIIARGKTPVVKMTLIETLKPKRRLGSAKGRVTISSDFSDTPADFREYSE
ncbi:type II toxin-antitoxin system Phd/YefM family antitoxin [bacterium]|nr:type II toxin-antitoxin system Phd/YefM family antitoxin [bacterium]